MYSTKNFFFIITMVSCLSLAFSSESQGSVVITFQETAGDGVLVSWSGSGTYSRPSVTTGSGDELDFNNFGSPFGDLILSPSTFTLTSPLILSGTDSSTSMSYTNTYEDIELFNTTNNGDDIDIQDTTDGEVSLVDGDTFEASGSGIATGLLFSNLVEGTYDAGGGDGTPGVEADAVGGVTLNIVALTTPVPEPSSLVLFGLPALGMIARRRRLRV